MGLASRKLPAGVPLNSPGGHPLDMPATCVWVAALQTTAAEHQKGKRKRTHARGGKRSPFGQLSALQAAALAKGTTVPAGRGEILPGSHSSIAKHGTEGWNPGRGAQLGSVVPIWQGCGLDPQSRHVQKSTREYIKWNDKVMFLSSSKVNQKILKKKNQPMNSNNSEF